jgi:hypothetical protein
MRLFAIPDLCNPNHVRILSIPREKIAQAARHGISLNPFDKQGDEFLTLLCDRRHFHDQAVHAQILSTLTESAKGSGHQARYSGHEGPAINEADHDVFPPAPAKLINSVRSGRNSNRAKTKWNETADHLPGIGKNSMTSMEALGTCK